MLYSQVTRVREYLENVIDKDPDIFLISEDGEHVGTHRILLRLFCPVFSDVFSNHEQISHISVPGSGSIVKHFLYTFTTGVAIATNVEELREVADFSTIFGLSSDQWQIGLGRVKKKTIVENRKVEDESAKDFMFDGKDEGDFSTQEILSHQNKKTETLDLKNEVQIGKDVKQTVECQKGPETFAIQANKREHTRVFHALKKEKEIDRKPFPCNFCTKTFLNKQYIQRHIRETHDVKNESKPFCSKCHKYHGFNIKDDKHYSCDPCKQKFYGGRMLGIHNMKKHGIRLRAARVIKVYVPEDPNHCHKCKVACNSKTHLIYHEDMMHNQGKKMICRFCEREFPRKASGFFLEHLRKHTGERPEICSHCGKSFKQKKSLQNHERLHTGEKPYKCESCFAAFTQRSGLVSHQKSRNGCQ